MFGAVLASFAVAIAAVEFDGLREKVSLSPPTVRVHADQTSHTHHRPPPVIAKYVRIIDAKSDEQRQFPLSVHSASFGHRNVYVREARLHLREYGWAGKFSGRNEDGRFLGRQYSPTSHGHTVDSGGASYVRDLGHHNKPVSTYGDRGRRYHGVVSGSVVDLGDGDVRPVLESVALSGDVNRLPSRLGGVVGLPDGRSGRLERQGHEIDADNASQELKDTEVQQILSGAGRPDIRVTALTGLLIALCAGFAGGASYRLTARRGPLKKPNKQEGRDANRG